MQPHPPNQQRVGVTYGPGGGGGGFGGGLGAGAGAGAGGGAQPYRGSPMKAQQAPSYEPSLASDKTVLPSIGKANQPNQTRRVGLHADICLNTIREMDQECN